ncbi:LOW QUALITY PROTEIN: male-specific lethal 1 homolog [Euwallacea similis]|uniref:LOW QUALITY PROTEIN: male-specific lethal 1 homolog n=1 Tax=Euwallacea similis TaxID=1736056 RepID=UPI00344E075C
MRLPTSSINNDQNIKRVVPKMNEDCQYDDGNNSNLIDSSLSYSNQPNNPNIYFSDCEKESFSGLISQEVGSSSDATDDNNRQQQIAESEVKLLKDWLILHNDLIQQQNDDIIEKDRQIYVLRKENEMLKKRLFCLEKGVPYLPEQQQAENQISEEDMTQDLYGQDEEDIKENIDILASPPAEENIVSCSLEVSKFQVTTTHIQNDDAESQVDTTINIDEDTDFKSEQDYIVTNNLSDSFTAESDTVGCISEYNFTVNSFSLEEFDPMKNIKMSIRRKRISSSSVLSNNEPLVTGEKKTTRRLKRKKRRLGKDTEILTTKDPYYVYHAKDDPPAEPEITHMTQSNLEVPRWRVKHYTSCYTMEGTENLDDEVYNKRHLRLEIDERRRKRWDVQRIREQRMVEKLKQRQERLAGVARGDNTDTQDSLTTLWPKADDVRYLEISDELPVSAFGHPIPKFVPSYFSLPWLSNPHVPTRRSSCSKGVRARERKRP